MHYQLITKEGSPFEGPAGYLLLEPPVDDVALLTECRMQCAPIRAHRGRALGDDSYANRVCWMCTEEVEDNEHFILRCPHYADAREHMITTIAKLVKTANEMGPTREPDPFYPPLDILEEYNNYKSHDGAHRNSRRLINLLLGTPPGSNWYMTAALWRDILSTVTRFIKVATAQRRKATTHDFQYW